MRNKKSLSKTLLRLGYTVLNTIIPQNRLGDKVLSLIYFVICHRRTPTHKHLFNDVLYRIKTTDEILNPLRVFVSDKQYVKLYVKAVVGERYNVPTIAVITDPGEVDLYDFPSDCCIKPSQASGRVVLRRNNSPVNREEIKSWFRLNHYRLTREANYRTLQPKVIVEPLIFESTNVADYKFFCRNGTAKLVQVDVNRHDHHERLFFDIEWNRQDFSMLYPKYDKAFTKPENFEEMKDVAQRLASGFDFVRIDLYSDGKSCLVGEITNCHGNAGENFIPRSGEQAASKIIFS